jgi:hypothetical protein
LHQATDSALRLNVQHKAFKAMQHDRNYLAPMDKALKLEEGKEKRLLDVGTGMS